MRLRLRHLALITFLLAVASSYTAAEADLPPGTSVLGPEPMVTLAWSLPEGASQKTQLIPLVDDIFPEAIQVHIKTQPAQPWSIQLVARTTEPIEAGDVLHMSFYMRTIEATDGVGRLEFVFERASSPWEKWATFLAETPVGGEWQRFDVPFVVGGDYPSRTAQATMRVGYPSQIIQIADVHLINYGKEVTVDQLQRTALSYAGKEPDAAWRQAARERIEKIRKGDLEIRVVDSDGQPIAGAEVGVHMQRHAFPFGATIYARTLNHPPNFRYREEFLRLFNAATIGNALKWPNWEDWGRYHGTRALEWLREHDIVVRGHNLVWQSWGLLPPDVRNLQNDPEALQKRILTHINRIVSELKGQIIGWDVVNEHIDKHVLTDILGLEAMVEWFQAAHEADPDAELFVNEYNILSAGGVSNKTQDAYYELIEYLLDNGAPLSGIGMQSHFTMSVTPPERIWAILDRFAVFGVPIWITEFDLQLNFPDSEDYQQFAADYLRDFYTAAFSHPAVEGIIIWGFRDEDWDGWLHQAPIFYNDWTLKPSGQAYIDLVFGEWWTDEVGKTDEDGVYRVRAFLGDYEIVASVDGKSVTVPAHVTKEGTQVTVQIDL